MIPVAPRRAIALVPVVFLVALALPCLAQRFVANYDEAKVPEFNLPDPLVLPEGGMVASAREWEADSAAARVAPSAAASDSRSEARSRTWQQTLANLGDVKQRLDTSRAPKQKL